MIIDTIVRRLKKETARLTPPLIDHIIAEYGKDPFLVLISCLLSLRARDVRTIHVCRALFAHARTPQEMLKLSRGQLEKLIYQSGFYKNKAKVLHEVSTALLERFDGTVPHTVEELMSIKGIGPKTAHLVVGQAFNIPAICVDVHVHRISNRLGVVRTTTVEQTEQQLRKILPKKYWLVWNNLLVMWGQNVCLPRLPWCSRCALSDVCQRVGVGKKR